jgi:hypothetical protein
VELSLIFMPLSSSVPGRFKRFLARGPKFGYTLLGLSREEKESMTMLSFSSGFSRPFGTVEV